MEHVQIVIGERQGGYLCGEFAGSDELAIEYLQTGECLFLNDKGRFPHQRASKKDAPQQLVLIAPIW